MALGGMLHDVLHIRFLFVRAHVLGKHHGRCCSRRCGVAWTLLLPQDAVLASRAVREMQSGVRDRHRAGARKVHKQASLPVHLAIT